MKESIRTTQAPQPFGPYSQAVKAGNRIYVSGQRPVDVNTGEMPADIVGQARQVLKNVQAILQAAGATLDDVVKVNVYLADLKDFAAFNSVYAEFFREPYPARTTIGAALRGILVEVDVIAELT
ncbi:2-iminobutanoate/2-iminopropanoate deaminase [Alicyclobacillus macrosporangiidus]|uniref:2-iminobutanoate/2-iminopropanoate deaminase n=1 Tax=Alicyclobacillus macrosporangiidus TaxID=392015 RepID=A0A1I7G7Y6_9BACL|nr:2-iminobutanoate/2-iminopropanoate deaminase [Alicyclobacillus macrosporangiidus]